jgi:hypothetical protein
MPAKDVSLAAASDDALHQNAPHNQLPQETAAKASISFASYKTCFVRPTCMNDSGMPAAAAPM